MPPVPQSADQVPAYVNSLLKDNKIVIFAKTTCPWCVKVKELFDGLHEKYTTVELDVVENGDEIKKYITAETKQTTVPNVFVNGSHVGGFDDTVKAQSSGRLAKMLAGDAAPIDLKKGTDESTESFVERIISSTPVVFFITTTCPWCKRLKAYFDEIHVKYAVFELDEIENGAEIRAYLAAKTNQTSVPSVFINGTFLGGHDSTIKAHKEGRVDQLLSPEIDAKVGAAQRSAASASTLAPKPGQSVESFVQDLVKANSAVVFSKTTCPFSSKVKDILKSINRDYVAIELDQISSGIAIRDYLYEKTGQKTVPNVFVNGKHIGGFDNTAHFHKEGRLSQLFETVATEDVGEYEYDLVVIGGGSGGLACSKAAAQLGKKVAVLDFVKPTPLGTTWGIGGTCVNVGCIPKKLMHQAALLGEGLKDSREFGWDTPENVKHTWQTMRENIQNHIGSLNFNYRVQLNDKKVKYINGYGQLVDNHKITATLKNGKVQELTTKDIVIAVGGRPKYPDDLKGGQEYCITSDDLFSLSYNPGKTLCVGASYVSLECAGFLKGIGLDVTVMVRSILLRGFDQQMANLIGDYMEKHEIKFHRSAVPVEVVCLKPSSADAPGELLVKYKNEKGEIAEETFNTVVLAVGREACTGDLNLDKVGVKLNKSKKILTTFEQSSVSNIYGIGDAVEESTANGRALELTPIAIKAGQLLAKRLYGSSEVKMDYSAVPTTVFTPIEYGSIGYSEEEAISLFGQENLEIYHTNFWPLEWTVAHRPHDVCYAKLICNKLDKDRVVGFHVAGPNAGEITQGYAVAFKLRVTKQDFDMTVGIHPTCSETFTTLTVTKSSGGDVGGSGC